jgi:phasin family protein
MLHCNLYIALQQREDFRMLTEDKPIEAKDVIEAPAKVAEKLADAVVETAKPVVAKAKAAAPAAKKIVVRKTKRSVTKAKKVVKAAPRKIKAAAPKLAAKERTIAVTNYDFFKGFDALPGFAPFQDMIAKANENGQQLAKKSQKVAEELADLARANVEAMVEASRVASEGAKSIGQDAVSTSRDGFEKAADAIRTLAEAKSPTEYLQLQGEFARASFDRMVAEGSKLTETMVKLAGEAFQPIQNRAAANAERFNTFVA